MVKQPSFEGRRAASSLLCFGLVLIVLVGFVRYLELGKWSNASIVQGFK